MSAPNAATAQLCGLAPGAYYERLEDGRIITFECFKDWQPEEGKPRVNGFYKKVWNCEEDAVLHLMKRGVVMKKEPSPEHQSPAGEGEHSERQGLVASPEEPPRGKSVDFAPLPQVVPGSHD